MGREPTDRDQFSLAGTQSKTARASEFSATEIIELIRNLALKLPDAAGEVLYLMAESDLG